MTMRLVCLIGKYAGHVLTYPDHVGENLLQGGLARYPTPGEDPEVEMEMAAQPSVEIPEQKGAEPMSDAQKILGWARRRVQLAGGVEHITKARLVEIAEEGEIEVTRTDGKKGAPRRADYFEAFGL